MATAASEQDSRRRRKRGNERLTAHAVRNADRNAGSLGAQQNPGVASDHRRKLVTGPRSRKDDGTATFGATRTGRGGPGDEDDVDDDDDDVHGFALSPKDKRSESASGKTRRSRHRDWRTKYGWLCLPYFFLLGTPKSGTTTLFEMITTHPQVIRTRKEPHWWTRARPEVTVVNYAQRHFHAASDLVYEAFARNRQQMVFGDASASMYWQVVYRTANDSTTSGSRHPLSEEARNLHLANEAVQQDPTAMLRQPTVPTMLRAILPGARLIVIFRNPVDRAVSEFAYFIQDETQINARHFESAVQNAINGFSRCVTAHKDVAHHNGLDPVNLCVFQRANPAKIRQGTIRLATGIYSRALVHWWTVYPRAALLILRSEDLRRRPVALLRKVFYHLRLSPLSDAALASLSKKHPESNKRPSSRSLVPPIEVSEKLHDFYSPFNWELAMLTNNSAFLWPAPSSTDH